MSYVRRVLPDGRIRIHWFQRDPQGPIRTGQRIEMLPGGKPLVLGGSVGRIVCMPGLDRLGLAPIPGTNLLQVIEHTDDPRAATCPECLASRAYQTAMRQLDGELDEHEDYSI